MHHSIEESDAQTLPRSADSLLDNLVCEKCMNQLSRRNTADLDVLSRLSLGSFDAITDGLNEFLGHLEIIESAPSFAAAAVWLEDLISQFELLDKNSDGRLSHEELSNFSDQTELSWISCHCDSLCKCDLLASQVHMLTLSALEQTRGVFRGLAYVQNHLAKMLDTLQPPDGVLSSSELQLYLALKHESLASIEYAALLQLANYLKKLENAEPKSRKQLSMDKLGYLQPDDLLPADQA